MTKENAQAVIDALECPGDDQTYGMAWYDGAQAALDALDAAGTFTPNHAEPKENVGEQLARKYGEDVARAVLAIANEDDPARAIAAAHRLRRVLAAITEYADELERVAIDGILRIHQRVGLSR